MRYLRTVPAEVAMLAAVPGYRTVPRASIPSRSSRSLFDIPDCIARDRAASDPSWHAAGADATRARACVFQINSKYMTRSEGEIHGK